MKLSRLGLTIFAGVCVWLATVPVSRGQAAYPRTFTDAKGHRVTLSAPPTRIASVVLGVDENLMDLVDPSRIVAMTQIATLPDVSNIASRMPAGKTLIRDMWQGVIDAKPDLVLAATYTPTLADPLIARKLPVYQFTEFNSIDDLLHNFELLGQLVGEETKAESILTADRALLAKAAEKRWPSPVRAIYFSEGSLYAKGTVPAEVIVRAGLVDAATEAGLSKYVTATPELMAKLKPDVILFGEDSAKAEQETVMMFRRPEYQTIDAVRRGRVHAIPGKHITTTSHLIVQAVIDAQAVAGK